MVLVGQLVHKVIEHSAESDVEASGSASLTALDAACRTVAAVPSGGADAQVLLEPRAPVKRRLSGIQAGLAAIRAWQDPYYVHCRRLRSPVMDSQELLESSRRWLHAGLEAYSREAQPLDFAVHHAGVGLEHLLKAYLASVHPALIVEPKDFDALLHAVGQSSHANIPRTRTKTIGLAEAFTRTKRLLRSGIVIDQRTFSAVCDARNGVAHAGVHDSQDVRNVLTICVRVATPILTELSVKPENYWCGYLKLTSQLAAEHDNALALAVETKMLRAKRAYSRRVHGLRAQERIGVIAALSEARMQWGEHDEQVDCPACEGKGWLCGHKEVDHDRAWTIVDGQEVPDPVVMFYASSFACAVCGLQLEGEELEAAGLRQENYLDEDPLESYGPEPTY